MKPTRPITRAWCVELQQEITIVTARREYFSQEPPRARFHFLCSSEHCRALGVKVTGVSYDVKPQDNLGTRAAHYRVNPNDAHCPDCEWIEEDATQAAVRHDETSEELAARQARTALDDVIDVFEPEARARREDTDVGSGTAEPASHRPSNPGRRERLTRTSDFERLVDYYRHARHLLPAEAFNALTLKVTGLGGVSLRSYFQHVRFARPGDNGRVIHGGGLVERYGTGFKFLFFDRIDGKRVSLYVSPERMKTYRSSRYLQELLSHANEVRFFTLYVLGSVSLSPSGKSVSIDTDDLRHLALVLGPAKNQQEPSVE